LFGALAPDLCCYQNQLRDVKWRAGKKEKGRAIWPGLSRF
jgi:hypothetical protein